MELRAMRIEEFLKENGSRYNLHVLGTKDDKLHIEVQTLKWDGEGSIREYLVKDNILFSLETESE
jgi:hypothetical protein